MKPYADYLDSISVDAALHESILQKAVRAPELKSRAARSHETSHKQGSAYLQEPAHTLKPERLQELTHTLRPERLQEPAHLQEPARSERPAKPSGPARLHQKRASSHYAGMAAVACTVCAAVLVLCIWVLPGLLNDPATPNYIPDDPSNPEQQDPSSPTNPQAPIDTSIHPLVFNTVNNPILSEASMLRRLGSAGPKVRSDLNNEQLQAVLPYLDFQLIGSASFNYNGSFSHMTAYEAAIFGGVEYPDGFITGYPRTTIELEYGEPLPILGLGGDIAPDDTNPQISDVHGVPVVAYVLDKTSSFIITFQANFKLDDLAYRVIIEDNREDGPARLAELVNALILGGGADLNALDYPSVSGLRYDELGLNEARLDSDFGAFVPLKVPDNYVLETAFRTKDTRSNHLQLFWEKTNGVHFYAVWNISKPSEEDLGRIVSVSDRAKYDMSLYPYFWRAPLPSGIEPYFYNPVFRAEELTFDVVRARQFWLDDSEVQEPDWRIMPFGVLFGDVFISIIDDRATPEELWEMLSSLEFYRSLDIP